MSDVSRLATIKEMLELIDFQCPSAGSLISLLCNAATNELFFKNKDGVEFISYVLTLDKQLMLLIDQAIKFSIPELKDAQLVKLGEVYYASIELAQHNGIVESYQKECLQGLVVSALHCHRAGPYKAAVKVLKVIALTF